jgi:ATP-dependent Zn protease
MMSFLSTYTFFSTISILMVAIIFGIVITTFIIGITKQKRIHQQNTNSNLYENISRQDTVVNVSQGIDQSQFSYGNGGRKNIHKGSSIALSIYFFFFSLIWTGAVVFFAKQLFSSLSSSNMGSFAIVPILMMILFFGIGIFLFIISITSFVKAIRNNPQPTTIKPDSPRATSLNQDDYFVRYCSYCGETLKKEDQVCPSCGAKVEPIHR